MSDDDGMECLSMLVAWVWEHPWERGLLCAETAILVISSPLVWWHRWSLKKQNEKVLAMMEKMVGQTEEEQRRIVKAAVQFSAGKPEVHVAGTAKKPKGTIKKPDDASAQD
ncbi:MAG: hypothetical protein F4213_20270 [Boseongicola sp. SB0677_bin_26]|nr:hypothetical protein [Boseongicola sp. SB0665_bin_10]MYG28322.1 hypothetical protein [Boseongicola sp. SB0677_bin_26]